MQMWQKVLMQLLEIVLLEISQKDIRSALRQRRFEYEQEGKENIQSYRERREKTIRRFKGEKEKEGEEARSREEVTRDGGIT
ncbi:hypothetical protein ACK8P5_26215 (plasmid) [Paenibacillus sp. EC2-1]|uniref:hypothetical protein n=1 Tax=Paenibacillus sp. EC2-1 TaxID=3388665 RepID=UPI003BEF0721